MDKEYQNQTEFIRLPKSGKRCPVSGLSRSAMNELVLPSEKNQFRPPVRSHSLRKPGQMKGIRLIDVKALKEFIRGLPA
jgi:hypothetical protein